MPLPPDIDSAMRILLTIDGSTFANTIAPIPTSGSLNISSSSNIEITPNSIVVV